MQTHRYTISRLLLTKGGCLGGRDKELKGSLPKEATLAVLGLDGAGKSTVFAALRGTATCLNLLAFVVAPFLTLSSHTYAGEPVIGVLPTIGQASDTVPFGKKTEISLFDLGGAEKIRGIWPKYFAETHGFLFVVDACDRQRFSEAKATLETVLAHKYMAGKPFTVLANKSDVPGAAGPEEIELALGLESEEVEKRGHGQFRVDSCTATKGTKKKTDSRILRGIRQLLYQIDIERGTLAPRRTADMTEHQKELDVARAAKNARVQKIREERERKAAAAEAAEAGENESPTDTGSGPACAKAPVAEPLATGCVEEGTTESVVIPAAASAATGAEVAVPHSDPTSLARDGSDIPTLRSQSRTRAKRNQVVPI